MGIVIILCTLIETTSVLTLNILYPFIFVLDKSAQSLALGGRTSASVVYRSAQLLS